MPTLPTLSFSAMVSNVVAGIQGRASKLINFSQGSTLRAIVEGFAGLYLWFQALVLQLLTAIRLSTASGIDVDTFVADFGLTRLGASASTGIVTFSRLTAAPSTCFVPVGATMQTTDGSQSFAVTVDTSYPNYSATLNGYTLAASVASMNVPVACTVAGSGGNVAIGAITVMTTPVTGIDNVINAAAFTNGVDFESDAALKARFVLYIASLAKGTEQAIGYSIVSTKVGMQYQIWEPGIGGFTQLTVYVDDGSGAIPSGVLASAASAANLTRAAGVPISIFAASVLTANVTMTIQTAAGYYHPTVVAQVVSAITLYINGLGLGVTPAAGTLSYMRMAQVAFNASPGVIDVTSYTLNGSNGDLVPAAGVTIKSGAIIVS